MSEAGAFRKPIRAVLVETGGRYYFYEPGIAVIGSGEALEEAYEKFIHSRREYVAETEKAGLRPDQVGIGQDLGRRGVTQELVLFVAKACIVGLFIAGLGAMAVQPLAALSMRDMGKKLALVAQDLQELKPEEKESLRRSLGIISQEVGPLGEAWRHPTSGK